ncbi:hypothetical protein PHLGIDRAFT_107563 [Phlebiopsis gigantea 11061_1 CR5-6]|uniref:Methyltransferase domain-containing protein n=1 Tax=Phlebiopsis gigantea (strain 11061_1 CR5-6) TaxID=745531 RepID=A0A0C3NLQ7_PHLG1|nr:hypothetical protein PHLGIDRAFT_107563 [Phlebiopsis gigantea 11061_1 CR5-6]
MYINSSNNSDEDVQDDDDDASLQSDHSDTSSDVTQLDHTDFPTYFRERSGRLFHSHGNAPYPLPVDTPEQQRVDAQHNLLYRLLGRHCRGPVARVVRERRRVLDICTGTGRWQVVSSVVLDMAQEFPDVRFDGIDIVPIATRTPPDNVYFEMADVNEPWRYRNGAFDLVHARSVSMAVLDYPALLDQAARVLRPGGLFLACEWARTIHIPGAADARAVAPHTHAFFDAVAAALRGRGIAPAARHLEAWLRESGQFERVSARTYEMPIGDWPEDAALRELGVVFRGTVMRTYAESMAVFLGESGWRADAVQDLLHAFGHELNTVKGMVCRYYTVRARRRVLA